MIDDLINDLNDGLNPNWDGTVLCADQNIFSLSHNAGDAPKIVTDRLTYMTIHKLLTAAGAN